MSEPTARTYNLIDRNGHSNASATPGALGGHRRSKIYGALNCPGARRWIAGGHYKKHRVFFADEETAISAGYRPCANCLPEAYAVWKAGQMPKEHTTQG